MVGSKKRKLIFIIWILIIVVIIVGIFFAFKRLNSGMQQYLKEKEDFSAFREKINTFEQRKARFGEQKKKMVKIENSFFERGENELERVGKFATNLEAIARKHNVSIEAKEIVQPTQNNNFYLLKFKLEGAFPGVLCFFFAIENTPFGNFQLMELQKISLTKLISGSCQEQGEGKCEKTEIAEGEFELRVYTEPKEEQQQEQQSNK